MLKSANYVCTAAESGKEALSLLSSGEEFELMLSDLMMPGMDGIEGTRRMKDLHPELAVLMLTVYDDDRRIFDALCAGACGYLLKKTPPARLLESLREVAGGGAPMSPEVARQKLNPAQAPFLDRLVALLGAG